MQANYQGGVYANYEGDIPVEGDTVLFFHADRCPTCNQAEKNFEQTGIPAGVTILKVNYDTENDLKEKYGILTQTSYVYVAPNGDLIKRRVGGTTIEDVLEGITDGKSGELKPWEKAAEKQGSSERKTAYFAGGCFRCLDGPFDSLEGVKEAVTWYIWGEADEAVYKQVASGKTKHREAVEVTYDPALVTYEELLKTYWRQIDPTDDGGQFADRGYQYTTAIYYTSDEEKVLAETAKQTLDESGKFDDPIVVEILPFPAFYPAEEYHQNYYLKSKNAYERYKKGSGRTWFIHDNRDEEGAKEIKQKEEQDLSHLTELQRRVTQEKATEKPFDNEYRDTKDPGIYVDVIDGTPLFSSTDKFDSKTWRPSFTKPIEMKEVAEDVDTSYGLVRTEVKSSTSDAHLGHIFNDGPAETGGQRYCINSAALKFVSIDDMERLGYGEWLYLFEE